MKTQLFETYLGKVAWTFDGDRCESYIFENYLEGKLFFKNVDAISKKVVIPQECLEIKIKKHAIEMKLKENPSFRIVLFQKNAS